MVTLQNGYRGLRLVIRLNLDRLMSVFIIAGSLALSAYLISF